nr:bifunctional indole-3-glycerol-phosphate synthase TrpC/phosphoribosylanthranilate isomerase TrpF [Alteromonas sp. a30]
MQSGAPFETISNSARISQTKTNKAGNILDKIVADKRIELVERKKTLPMESFVQNLKPSTRSFYDALSKPNAGYILECKKASPSKGLIRDPFDLDEILDAYEPYASALSVLTDEKYFQGKFEYLDYVTSKVSIPVLNKDFFVDPYQIHLARYHNADAVLLMLSVLNDDEYRELAELAKSYNMGILTEVSNEEEAHRAIALGADIIGINNRNLRDLSTDLATTEMLAPLLSQNHKQSDENGRKRLLISESGIYTYQDVRRLAPLVDGFLVGSSLMAQADVKQAAARLTHGNVKVCGITREQDAIAAKMAGASYLGLIFAPASKRKVTLEKAKSIVAACSHHYVGVFVNADINIVVEYATQLQLTAVQLHGKEDQAYIDALRQQLPSYCQIWKAKGVKANSDMLPPLNEQQVDLFLLDCQVGTQSGGTGQQFNWQLLDALNDKSNIALAGGLNPDNVSTAGAQGAALIDINSGVESAPGIKDDTLIQQAFTALRAY